MGDGEPAGVTDLGEELFQAAAEPRGAGWLGYARARMESRATAAGGRGGAAAGLSPARSAKKSLQRLQHEKNAFNLTLDLRSVCRRRSTCHRGGLRRRSGRLRPGGRLDRFRLHDVDAALEIRAIFDDDARRADIEIGRAHV